MFWTWHRAASTLFCCWADNVLGLIFLLAVSFLFQGRTDSVTYVMMSFMAPLKHFWKQPRWLQLMELSVEIQQSSNSVVKNVSQTNWCSPSQLTVVCLHLSCPVRATSPFGDARLRFRANTSDLDGLLIFWPVLPVFFMHWPSTNKWLQLKHYQPKANTYVVILCMFIFFLPISSAKASVGLFSNALVMLWSDLSCSWYWCRLSQFQ